MSEHVVKPPRQREPAAGRLTIFTGRSGKPEMSTLDRLSAVYGAGFNEPPWDVYEWNYTPEKARREYFSLVDIILKNNGSLITLEDGKQPAGFLLSVGLGVFVRRLKETEKFKRMPQDFHHPGRYLETLADLFGVPVTGLDSVSYLASIAVDEYCRGRGYSKMLLEAGLDYDVKTGKNFVLGWTVNPRAARSLVSTGFERLPCLGESGEGIDFMFHGRTWYASLDLPAKGRTTAEGRPVIAEHYILKL